MKLSSQKLVNLARKGGLTLSRVYFVPDSVCVPIKMHSELLDFSRPDSSVAEFICTERYEISDHLATEDAYHRFAGKRLVIDKDLQRYYGEGSGSGEAIRELMSSGAHRDEVWVYNDEWLDSPVAIFDLVCLLEHEAAHSVGIRHGQQIVETEQAAISGFPEEVRQAVHDAREGFWNNYLLEEQATKRFTRCSRAEARLARIQEEDGSS